LEGARFFQPISSCLKKFAKIQQAILNLPSSRAKQAAKEDLRKTEKNNNLRLQLSVPAFLDWESVPGYLL
jgi:hypothetical protein